MVFVPLVRFNSLPQFGQLQSRPQQSLQSPSMYPSSIWSYIFELHIVILVLMTIIYKFPILYVILCIIIYFSLLPSYCSFSINYTSLCLLFSVLYASFHGMGITGNLNFIISFIHYGILICAFKLLPVDHQRWFRSSYFIRFTLFLSLLITLIGTYLPVWEKYKETGIFDIKSVTLTNNLTSLDSLAFSRLGPEISILPIVCYFVACSIVIRTKNQIHISKAILISIFLFILPTIAYVFIDPIWLVEFYNKIKYAQLYFLIPAFYMNVPSLMGRKRKSQ